MFMYMWKIDLYETGGASKRFHLEFVEWRHVFFSSVEKLRILRPVNCLNYRDASWRLNSD